MSMKWLQQLQWGKKREIKFKMNKLGNQNALYFIPKQMYVDFIYFLSMIVSIKKSNKIGLLFKLII